MAHALMGLADLITNPHDCDHRSYRHTAVMWFEPSAGPDDGRRFYACDGYAGQFARSVAMASAAGGKVVLERLSLLPALLWKGTSLLGAQQVTASMERLCDWVVNKDKVWVHGDRITDGHVALDMRLTPGLDPGEVGRDGQWVLRKAQPSRWVAEQHPDLSDVIPGPADGSDWSEVAWSAWVTRGLRIGALRGAAVAVDHGWLSRLQPGYRIEGSPGHGFLRIVTKKPEPSLLSGGPVHQTVVGVVMPAPIDAGSCVAWSRPGGRTRL